MVASIKLSFPSTLTRYAWKMENLSVKGHISPNHVPHGYISACKDQLCSSFIYFYFFFWLCLLCLLACLLPSMILIFILIYLLSCLFARLPARLFTH